MIESTEEAIPISAVLAKKKTINKHVSKQTRFVETMRMVGMCPIAKIACNLCTKRAISKKCIYHNKCYIVKQANEVTL